MNLFEELCQAMAECEYRNIQYVKKAQEYSIALAESIRKMLGVPESWQDPRDRKDKPYVEAVAVDRGRNEFQNFDVPSIAFDDNSFYLFNIIIHLKMPSDSYDRRKYIFHCGVKPRVDDMCIVYADYRGLEETRQEFKVCATAGFSEPARHILGTLKKYLEFNKFAQ